MHPLRSSIYDRESRRPTPRNTTNTSISSLLSLALPSEQFIRQGVYFLLTSAPSSSPSPWFLPVVFVGRSPPRPFAINNLRQMLLLCPSLLLRISSSSSSTYLVGQRLLLLLFRLRILHFTIIILPTPPPVNTPFLLTQRRREMRINATRREIEWLPEEL